MFISIIIPAYNEAQNIGRLISYLQQNSNGGGVEIIVSDGGSQDQTIAVARIAGATVVSSPAQGRAEQMNYGASLSSGEVLYFVHADCFPPKSFVADIEQATRQGYDLGRYRTKFDSAKTIFRFNAWFTRFDLFISMGGDQTLFVRRSLFKETGGFNNEMKIMEEYEFCERARAKGRYTIMNGAALISARKYETNSWWRVQSANAVIICMYKRGASQQKMVDRYKQLLRYRKNAF